MAKLREAKEAAEREIGEFRAQMEADFQRRLAEVRIRSISAQKQSWHWSSATILHRHNCLLAVGTPHFQHPIYSVLKLLAFEFCLLFKLFFFFFFPLPFFILPTSWFPILMRLVEGWRVGLQFKIFPTSELKLRQHEGCKCFMNIVEWFSCNVLRTTLLCHETSPMHFAFFFMSPFSIQYWLV